MSDLTKNIIEPVRKLTARNSVIRRDIETEFLRKAIHLTIAFVPVMASFSIGFTMAMLAAGTIVYTYAELLRLRGISVVLISRITVRASRQRDFGRFVLGPVTLAMGAMLSLMLYPEPAAVIAIYALAFGDSLASIVGKLFGQIKIPLSGGKTVLGTLACFTAVTVAAYIITGNLFIAVQIGIIASLLEALPLGDLDNIVLPLGTGFAASVLLGIL